MTEQPVTIVQFTDTHFFASSEARLLGVDTAGTFAEVAKLARERSGTPLLYLLTGDLSQDETARSYARLAECLKDFQAPVYYLPGNHDLRQAMSKAFNESGAPIRDAKRILISNWQIILLDTLVEGKIPGRLSEAELKRLDVQLSEHPQRHALIAMHHPPVAIGCRWMDAIGLENGAEFLRIIDRHKQVKVILWGHIHQEYDSAYGAVRLLATPSTGLQFKPGQEKFAVDAVPPGYRFLQLNQDGTLTTQVWRTASVPEGLEVSSPGY